jgi:hypothetical protein
MSQWVKHYGPTPTIGIYTNWPELITDSKNSWNIKFLGDFSVIDTMAEPKLHRWTARVHDRHFDLDYPHCLYIKDPVPIDLSVLKLFMDLKHAVYLDVHEHFVLYRRQPEYNITAIDLTTKSQIGVIFIDCWASILTSSWEFSKNYTNPGMNFYENMLEILSRYNIDSYIFAHGYFPLTHYLYDWAYGSQGKRVPYDFNFADYYKSVGINRWIVVGAHWQHCTHKHKIGFIHAGKLIKQDSNLEIYSIPECTVKFVVDNPLQRLQSTLSQEDYDTDTLSWQYTDKLAKLIVK